MTLPLSARDWMLLAILVAPLAIALLVGPIAQAPGYHALADDRTLAALPNFANVASNLPFLLFALLGLEVLRRRPSGAVVAWGAVFAGTALAAVGSSWYHLAPSDATLFWDMLPITLTFAGLLAALLAEHVDARLERLLLAPLVLLGVASVYWWALTGDLRIYAWMQAAPLVALVTVLAAYPARYSGRSWLMWGLGCYALAKAAEFSDAWIYELTGRVLSGHTLKHLVASGATLCIALMLARRVPVAPKGSV
jgi:hypothetical protein